MTERKKKSQGKVKRHLQVLFSLLGSEGVVDNLCHYSGTSQYGAGWGALPCGGLSDTSAGDLVDEGNSLPFEKSAVQLLKLKL